MMAVEWLTLLHHATMPEERKIPEVQKKNVIVPKFKECVILLNVNFSLSYSFHSFKQL
jgi:hypothetical protein